MVITRGASVKNGFWISTCGCAARRDGESKDPVCACNISETDERLKLGGGRVTKLPVSRRIQSGGTRPQDEGEPLFRRCVTFSPRSSSPYCTGLLICRFGG